MDFIRDKSTLVCRGKAWNNFKMIHLPSLFWWCPWWNWGEIILSVEYQGVRVISHFIPCVCLFTNISTELLCNFIWHWEFLKTSILKGFARPFHCQVRQDYSGKSIFHAPVISNNSSNTYIFVLSSLHYIPVTFSMKELSSKPRRFLHKTPSYNYSFRTEGKHFVQLSSYSLWTKMKGCSK